MRAEETRDCVCQPDDVYRDVYFHGWSREEERAKDLSDILKRVRSARDHANDSADHMNGTDYGVAWRVFGRMLDQIIEEFA